MIVRLIALVLAATLLAPAAVAQLQRGDRSRPAVGDLQRILVARGMEAPNDIAEHRCEPRPSALFGQHTYRCNMTLTGGAQVTFVITFDGRWVVVGQ